MVRVCFLRIFRIGRFSYGLSRPRPLFVHFPIRPRISDRQKSAACPFSGIFRPRSNCGLIIIDESGPFVNLFGKIFSIRTKIYKKFIFIPKRRRRLGLPVLKQAKYRTDFICRGRRRGNRQSRMSNPSVSLRLTAPFTQGSLWMTRSRKSLFSPKSLPPIRGGPDREVGGGDKPKSRRLLA